MGYRCGWFFVSHSIPTLPFNTIVHPPQITQQPRSVPINSFRKRKTLIIHSRTHPGFCSDCGEKRGFSVEEIIAHQTKRHIAEFPHICKQCGDSFARNQQFQFHMASHGRDESKCKCPPATDPHTQLAL